MSRRASSDGMHLERPTRVSKDDEPRKTTVGMRRLLAVAAVLVFLAGVQLFVFTERTDRYFAWTIALPLTAAFLGAGYWASVGFEALAAREQVWARARIAVPGVLVFTALTEVATLMHLDAFHLDASIPLSTRLVTWAWIGIYTVVPIAMLVLLRQQLDTAGSDPPVARRFPTWMRGLVALQGAIMLLVGAMLFLAPPAAVVVWPWTLTPLTARAIGAWLLGMAVVAAQATWENDFLRVRPAAVSYVVLGVLQTIAVVRYPEPIAWDRPQAWIYMGVLLSMVAVGAYALVGATRTGASGVPDTSPAST